MANTNHTLRTPRPALRFALLLAVAGGVGTTTGCRHIDNAQVDVLERELRQQESYIYELEDYLLEYSEKLRACRCANPGVTIDGDSTTTTPSAARQRAPLEPELADDPLPSQSRRTPELAEPDADSEVLPEADDELPAPEEFDPGDFDPSDIDVPDLEIGPTSDARSPQAAPRYAAASTDELLLPNPAGFDEPAEPLADAPEPPLVADELQLVEQQPAPPLTTAEPTDALQLAAAAPVTGDPVQLEIRHVLRGEPSDPDGPVDKLFVVLEVLDEHGNPVALADETSVMILHEDAPGSLQAVQRWDFKAEEAAAAWQASALGEGLHFELPLRGATLPAGEVQVWARTMPAEGEKLLAKQTLDASTAPTLEQALVVSEPPIVEPGADAAARPIQSAAAPATKWRQSATPLGAVVEGFATTASQSGWTAGNSDATRVQPATASAPADSETWQRR